MGSVPLGTVDVNTIVQFFLEYNPSVEAALRSFNPTALHASLTRRGNKLAGISYFLQGSNTVRFAE